MVTTGPTVPPADGGVSELDAAEREQATAERALEVKLKSAVHQCAVVGPRARQLLHFAEKHGLPGTAPACVGLKSLVAPKLDAAAAARLHDVRLAALESRRQALRELERTLAAVAAVSTRLAELEHQVRAEATAHAAHGHSPEPPPTKVPPGSESRRAPRVRLERTVDLSSDDNFFVGFANDISVGGLFVATSDPPPRGALVELVFTLPDGTRIEAEGEVRWTREYDDRAPYAFPGVGIQFKRLPPAALTAIGRFVQEREAMFYDD